MTQSCPHLAKRFTALLEAGKSLLTLPGPPSSNSNFYLKGSSSLEQDSQSPFRELLSFLPLECSEQSAQGASAVWAQASTCQPMWILHPLDQRLRRMHHTCLSKTHRNFWNLEMQTSTVRPLSGLERPSLRPLYALPIWPRLHHPSSKEAPGGGGWGERGTEREPDTERGRGETERKRERKRERWGGGVTRGYLGKTEHAQIPSILRYQAHQ